MNRDKFVPHMFCILVFSCSRWHHVTRFLPCCTGPCSPCTPTSLLQRNTHYRCAAPQCQGRTWTWGLGFLHQDELESVWWHCKWLCLSSWGHHSVCGHTCSHVQQWQTSLHEIDSGQFSFSIFQSKHPSHHHAHHPLQCPPHSDTHTSPCCHSNPGVHLPARSAGCCPGWGACCSYECHRAPRHQNGIWTLLSSSSCLSSSPGIGGNWGSHPGSGSRKCQTSSMWTCSPSTTKTLHTGTVSFQLLWALYLPLCSVHTVLDLKQLVVEKDLMNSWSSSIRSHLPPVSAVVSVVFSPAAALAGRFSRCSRFHRWSCSEDFWCRITLPAEAWLSSVTVVTALSCRLLNTEIEPKPDDQNSTSNMNSVPAREDGSKTRSHTTVRFTISRPETWD